MGPARTVRLVAALVITAAAVLLPYRIAMACSCAMPDLRDALEESEAAIVGTIEDRDNATFSDRATFTIRIERALKGGFGDTVQVDSSKDGASCGIEAAVGSRVGLFLSSGQDGRWGSSLCSTVDADALLAAAGEMPPPDGEGPPALLVGGNMGPARLFVMDGHGRFLAYGMGDGAVWELALCPGARRVVEVAIDGGGESRRELLAVRDLETLEIVWEVVLPRERDVHSIVCTDPDGSLVRVLATEWPEGSKRGRLVEVTARGARDVGSVAMSVGHAQDGEFFVADGSVVSALVWETGEARELARFPHPVWSFDVSPDRRHVAATMAKGGDARGVAVTETGAPPETARTLPSEHRGDHGLVRWTPYGTFAYLPWGGGDSAVARVFDVELREQARVPEWSSIEAQIDDDVAFGVGWGVLLAGNLESGRLRATRYHDREVWSLALIPGVDRSMDALEDHPSARTPPPDAPTPDAKPPPGTLLEISPVAGDAEPSAARYAAIGGAMLALAVAWMLLGAASLSGSGLRAHPRPPGRLPRPSG